MSAGFWIAIAIGGLFLLAALASKDGDSGDDGWR